MSDTEYFWYANNGTESVDSDVYRCTHDLTPRPDPLNPPVYTNSGSTGQYQLRAKPSPSNIKTHRPDIMSEHYQFDIKCRLDGSEIWTGFTKSNTKCRISGQTTCLALCDLWLVQQSDTRSVVHCSPPGLHWAKVLSVHPSSGDWFPINFYVVKNDMNWSWPLVATNHLDLKFAKYHEHFR